MILTCNCVTTRDVSKHIIYWSTIFSIFKPPCLVLHSFSALQNQPLLILNMYDFGDVKGTQPFDLTLHTVDSKITRLLYDPRFRQVECVQFTFLSPSPNNFLFVKFSMFCEWINKTWIFRNKVMLFLNLIPPKIETHIPTTR